MKTIQVSDEMYESLIEISKEMNNQDNRCTASPYFYQIQTQEKDYSGSDYIIWFNSNKQEEIERDNEINEEVLKILSEKYPSSLIKISNYGQYEKEKILEDNGWEVHYYSYQNKYENAFFTEKACREHIRLNHYHYNEPKDYLNHAFRNPEMELIQKFLTELTHDIPNE